MERKYLIFNIVNSLFCIGLFFLSLGVFTANLMSVSAVGADESGILQSILFYLTIPFPIIPFISIIGSWIAWYKKSKKYTILFISFPWVYSIILLIILVLFFVSAG